MVLRDFWTRRLRQVWERVPIAWLAGVRRVGKTTLVRSLPEAECLYVNCDSPRTAQSVADPEFFFEQIRQPIVIFDEIHQLPDPTRLVRPYHAGKGREWTHQPKAYAFDTGFICHARGWESLRADDCGPLWEHLVLDTLMSVEDPAKILFWRDHQQREVDFVMPRGRDAVEAYECKWGGLKPDLRNLHAFRQIYPHGKNYFVIPQLAPAQALHLEGLEIQMVSPKDLMPKGEGT